MSAERFQRLGTRVNLAVFWGNTYASGKQKDQWQVQVEFREIGGTQINFTEWNAFLEGALHYAYERLDKIVSNGLGASAMLPAIEHKPEVDDEIPF